MSNKQKMVSAPPYIGLEPLVGRYYPAICRRCGWVGSSEELTEDDAQCTRDIGDRLCLGDCDELDSQDLLAIIQAMAQPQGEPMAFQWRCKTVNDGSQWRHWVDCTEEDYNKTIENPGPTSRGIIREARRLYAEQPAPVAAVPLERSPKDYAIEHAEYMAKSADDVLAKFQTYGLALLAVDEGGDDGEGELFEAIDSARQDLQESLVDMCGMVYEFRKRSNRCTPQ
nr:hypothetical protein [uncultured Pseudomonas sp.]